MSYINKSKLFKLSDKIDEAQDFIGHKLKSHGENIIVDLDITQITVREQVRKEFSEESITNLAQSISHEGLLYPILVMEIPNQETIVSKRKYILIVGENRYRAFKQLKRKTIPARVVQYTEDSSKIMLIQLTENIQRKNLNPIELAESLMAIKKNLKITLEILSQKVGRSVDNLKKYSRINKLTKKEKDQCKNYTFNEIIRYINTKSASEALLSKTNQLPLFKETKNGVELKSIKLNFNTITLEELESKVEACETFLKVARDRIDSLR